MPPSPIALVLRESVTGCSGDDGVVQVESRNPNRFGIRRDDRFRISMLGFENCITDDLKLDGLGLSNLL